ncbi:MAG: hypothetical protein HPY50_04325 [Firmicutes bacterium]|nr:hypothetical protein [Bacillota bacterium]
MNKKHEDKRLSKTVKWLKSKNIPFKLLALMLSVLLWAFATSERQVKVPDTVLDNVQVKVEGMNPALLLAEQPGVVQVTLRGDVTSLNTRDLQAVIDLSGAGAGEASMPVQVSAPSGITVVSVKPAKLKIRLESWQEKQVPVEVVSNGKVKEGMQTLTPVVRPSQVIVRGGASALANLHKAYVTVDLKDAGSSLNEVLPVRLSDRSGNLNQGTLQASPPTVEVTIPVVKDRPGKMVTVTPVINGIPAAGFHQGQAWVEPATVKVFATPEVLNGVTRLNTEPISIQGAQGNLSQNVRLVLPPGVEAAEPIQVAIQVSIISEKDVKNLNVPVKEENLGTGLTATVQPTEVALKLNGPAGQLENLTAADLKASVNLAGLAAGEYQLMVNITAPNGINVLQTAPAEVKVVVK